MMKKAHVLNWGILFCLVWILAGCSPTIPQKIVLQPCQVGEPSAQCGVLTVFENRATNTGRKIDLHVAVIKARGPNPAPDPIFYLAGGPGASAIDTAGYAMLMLKSANERRDLVLVDQRGTGQSNRLACPRQVDESLGLVPIDEQAPEPARLPGETGRRSSARTRLPGGWTTWTMYVPRWVTIRLTYTVNPTVPPRSRSIFSAMASMSGR